MENNKTITKALGYTIGFVTLSQVNAANLYELTDLGALHINQQEAQNLRIKINENNQVVGWGRQSSQGKITGFIWDTTNGFLQPLGGESHNQFSAINSGQQIVGYSTDANGNQKAARWSSDFASTIELGTLGGAWSIANGINSDGTIVGQSVNGNDVPQAFIWSNNNMSPVLSDGSNSSADAINDEGWIAGTQYSNPSQAFAWNGSSASLLNTVDNMVRSSWSSGINNLNEIVGGLVYSYDATNNPRYFRTHAYRWSNVNGLDLLGANIEGISWAIENNNSGLVVGGRLYNLLDRQAILWEADAAYNLNALTQNLGAWQLVDATDINDAGNIVGIGIVGEAYRAFMLTPVVTGVAAADLNISIKRTSPSTKPGSKNIVRNLAVDSNDQLLVEVQNQGPDDASDVTFTIDTTMNLNAVDIAANGNCVEVNATIECSIDFLAVNSTETISIGLKNIDGGEFDFKAAVTANEPDAGPNINNQVEEVIKVTKVATPVTTNPSSDTVVDNGSTDSQPSDNQDNSGTENENVLPDDEVNVKPVIDKIKNEDPPGCSIGQRNTFDPVLLLLFGLALLGLKRNRISRKRDKYSY